MLLADCCCTTAEGTTLIGAPPQSCEDCTQSAPTNIRLTFSGVNDSNCANISGCLNCTTWQPAIPQVVCHTDLDIDGTYDGDSTSLGWGCGFTDYATGTYNNRDSGSCTDTGTFCQVSGEHDIRLRISMVASACQHPSEPDAPTAWFIEAKGASRDEDPVMMTSWFFWAVKYIGANNCYTNFTVLNQVGPCSCRGYPCAAQDSGGDICCDLSEDPVTGVVRPRPHNPCDWFDCVGATGGQCSVAFT